MKRALIAGITGLFLLAAQPARAETPDSWLTAKVKIALLTDAEVGGRSIHVDTYDGNVTLHGKAASPAEKQRAADLARKISGVKDVRNLIAVVPKERREQVKLDDKLVERRVTTLLGRDAALEDSQIKVKSVNDGVVVLEGRARSVSDHLRALEDARAVEGVARVASEIQSPDKLADHEIWAEDPNDPRAGEGSAWDAWTTAAVKLRLLGKRDIPGLSINVDTTDGIVTLFGVVPSKTVAELAVREALEARGAKRVVNDLQIVPDSLKKQVAARDDEISTRLSKRIKDAALDHDTDVDFQVNNGVVRLTGSVPSEHDRLDVLTVTRSTEGVRSVLDDMTLASDADRRDRQEDSHHEPRT